jgi:hypothetical protein
MYPPISHRDGSWTQSIGVDGAAPVETGSTTFFNAVSPRYFATTGTRLIAGREFADADGPGAERVAIVNESLAARAFPGQNAIGHRITVGRHADRQSLTIVGIVADATYQRMQEEPRAIAYLPFRQTTDALTGRSTFLVARASNRPQEIADAVRAALVQSHPGFAVRAEPLGNRMRESLITERILAVLASGLAVLALFLACAGLFGLLMHLVARRTQEIGVRMALGARPSDVVQRRADSRRAPRHRPQRSGCLPGGRWPHTRRGRRRRLDPRTPRRLHQSDRGAARRLGSQLSALSYRRGTLTAESR